MSDIRENMDKAIDSLKHNFAKVRTGRAKDNVQSEITLDLNIDGDDNIKRALAGEPVGTVVMEEE